MRARALMVQGCSSHAGKSVLTAALCRLFARRGLAVAPFKAVNMSLNAAVCPAGGEIGRAQAVQARASGRLPTSDMNPVLLKPESGGCQVVFRGRAVGRRRTLTAAFRERVLWPGITGSLQVLGEAAEVLLVEGAGSPAEPNLRARDLANMRVALHLRCPVILVVDIDRGGGFAAVLGTLALLAPRERRLVKGWVVNRLRGDPRGLAPAVREIERRTGKPCLGVLPFLEDLGLEEEDAVHLENAVSGPGPFLAVPRLPHLSNTTDLQPLAAAGVAVRYVTRPAEIPGALAVILPGSKHTLHDLAWLKRRGLDRAIRAYARRGGRVVGICGGFQMMGRSLEDPEGHDGGRPARGSRGLDLLPVTTRFEASKVARLASGRSLLPFARGLDVSGYEIHAGRVTRLSGPAAFELDVAEGAAAPGGRVWGTSLHGLFDGHAFRTAFLSRLGIRPSALPSRDPLDRWADHVAAHLDMGRLARWLRA